MRAGLDYAGIEPATGRRLTVATTGVHMEGFGTAVGTRADPSSELCSELRPDP